MRFGFVSLETPRALAKGSPLNFQCDLIIFLRQILIPLLHLKFFMLSGVEGEVMVTAGKFFECFD